MTHEFKVGGGDQRQGGATPHVIAARTVETAPPETTGGPHNTTFNEQRITTDPLWPLVIVLGDIVQRACKLTDNDRTATTEVA